MLVGHGRISARRNQPRQKRHGCFSASWPHRSQAQGVERRILLFCKLLDQASSCLLNTAASSNIDGRHPTDCLTFSAVSYRQGARPAQWRSIHGGEQTRRRQRSQGCGSEAHRSSPRSRMRNIGRSAAAHPVSSWIRRKTPRPSRSKPEGRREKMVSSPAKRHSRNCFSKCGRNKAASLSGKVAANDCSVACAAAQASNSMLSKDRFS